MSSRQRVVQLLGERVGFQFNESELSPSLRQKIGELANTREQLDANQYLIATHESQIRTMTYEGGGSRSKGFVSLVIGGILTAFGTLGAVVEGVVGLIANEVVYLILFLTPGVILLLYSYLQLSKATRNKSRVLNANWQISMARDQMTRLNASYIPQVSVVSQLIMTELSSLHSARITPVPATSGSQIIKETILKEVVMIPCAYCKGLMPQTATFCPHCGAQRRS